MILKWINQTLLSFTNPKVRSTETPQTKSSILGPKNPDMIDIANAALKNDAQTLSGILAAGGRDLKRNKLKKKIKGKVAKVISSEYDDPDVVEEITERILDAAEFDPYYREMFDVKEVCDD